MVEKGAGTAVTRSRRAFDVTEDESLLATKASRRG